MDFSDAGGGPDGSLKKALRAAIDAVAAIHVIRWSQERYVAPIQDVASQLTNRGTPTFLRRCAFDSGLAPDELRDPLSPSLPCKAGCGLTRSRSKRGPFLGIRQQPGKGAGADSRLVGRHQNRILAVDKNLSQVRQIGRDYRSSGRQIKEGLHRQYGSMEPLERSSCRRND